MSQFRTHLSLSCIVKTGEKRVELVIENSEEVLSCDFQREEVALPQPGSRNFKGTTLQPDERAALATKERFWLSNKGLPCSQMSVQR
jgi:hypothetical protein